MSDTGVTPPPLHTQFPPESHPLLTRRPLESSASRSLWMQPPPPPLAPTSWRHHTSHHPVTVCWGATRSRGLLPERVDRGQHLHSRSHSTTALRTLRTRSRQKLERAPHDTQLILLQSSDSTAIYRGRSPLSDGGKPTVPHQWGGEPPVAQTSGARLGTVDTQQRERDRSQSCQPSSTRSVSVGLSGHVVVFWLVILADIDFSETIPASILRVCVCVCRSRNGIGSISCPYVPTGHCPSSFP
jgi:hypothetical protein